MTDRIIVSVTRVAALLCTLVAILSMAPIGGDSAVFDAVFFIGLAVILAAVSYAYSHPEGALWTRRK